MYVSFHRIADEGNIIFRHAGVEWKRHFSSGDTFREGTADIIDTLPVCGEGMDGWIVDGCLDSVIFHAAHKRFPRVRLAEHDREDMNTRRIHVV